MSGGGITGASTTTDQGGQRPAHTRNLPHPQLLPAAPCTGWLRRGCRKRVISALGEVLGAGRLSPRFWEPEKCRYCSPLVLVDRQIDDLQLALD
jgi:hypothetical protein